MATRPKALVSAVKGNQVNEAQRLIKSGVNPNINDGIGGWFFLFIPLLIAAKGGQLEMVNVLLQHHADVNIEDSKKSTALHFAVWQGHMKIVKRLLAVGANFNKANWYGNTPLHVASIWKKVDCIQVLFKYGANIDAKNFFGFTPKDLPFLGRTTKDELEKLWPVGAQGQGSTSAEASRANESTPYSENCVTCGKVKPSSVLYPCQHACLCYTCAEDVMEHPRICPVCGQGTKKIKSFEEMAVCKDL